MPVKNTSYTVYCCGFLISLSICFQGQTSLRGFMAPSEPLAQTLDSTRSQTRSQRRPNYRNQDSAERGSTEEGVRSGNSIFYDASPTDDISSPSAGNGCYY